MERETRRIGMERTTETLMENYTEFLAPVPSTWNEAIPVLAPVPSTWNEAIPVLAHATLQDNVTAQYTVCTEVNHWPHLVWLNMQTLLM